MAEYNGTIDLISGLRPKNNGTFPLVNAKDVQMPDGTRLSDFEGSGGGAYPEAAGTSELSPDTYYIFGEVDVINVTLKESGDGKAHEYCFEFIPSQTFQGVTITPEIKWAQEGIYFESGKVHQISILRGVGVMVSA